MTRDFLAPLSLKMYERAEQCAAEANALPWWRPLRRQHLLRMAARFYDIGVLTDAWRP